MVSPHEKNPSTSRSTLVKVVHAPGRIAREMGLLPMRPREIRAWSSLHDVVLPLRACDGDLRELAAFVRSNADVAYTLSSPIVVGELGGGNYVGAQPIDRGAVFVPNGRDVFARVYLDGGYDLTPFDKTGNEGAFRWTGGALWRGMLVCFPRTSNDLLLLNLGTNESKLVSLGQGYKKEHHYGGVLCGGVVYQPPRDEDHLLRIDLRTMEARKIPLAPGIKGFKARYCGSALHPNGLVYFLPERGRVIEFDPETERFRYIGKPLNALAFGAALAPDGCLYGFSAYAKGILRIDPREGTARMLRTDIGCPGAYGTRLGVNGKLYSVPGDGDFVYEYEPDTGSVAKLCPLGRPGAKAKCAGSAMTASGAIFFAPAFEPNAYFLRPSRAVDIPGKIQGLFEDCY